MSTPIALDPVIGRRLVRCGRMTAAHFIHPTPAGAAMLEEAAE